jgi:hypothetical protein
VLGVGNGRGGGHHFATGPRAVRQGSRKVGLLKCAQPMGAILRDVPTLRLEADADPVITFGSPSSVP